MATVIYIMILAVLLLHAGQVTIAQLTTTAAPTIECEFQFYSSFFATTETDSEGGNTRNLI